MMKTVSILGLILLAACGDAGGVAPHPPTPIPSPAELVPEPIPYDSLGGTTVYFGRHLRDRVAGYVRISPQDRSITVYHAFNTFLWPAVSKASGAVAYWQKEWEAGPFIYVKALAAPKSDGTRISRIDNVWRSGPSWSADGRMLYYIEWTSPNSRVARIVRQSPVPDAKDWMAITDLPPACDFQKEGPAVAATGDVLVMQMSLKPDGTCTWETLHWREADRSLSVRPDLSGLPAWSPDGARIAVMRITLGRLQIVVSEASGSKSALIFDAPPEPRPASAGYDSSICWSGDGSRIVFTKSAGISSIRPDGSGLTTITSPGTAAPTASEPGSGPVDGAMSCTG